MKLVTVQWKGVLDIIKEQGIYHASYGYGYRQYIAQYQNLADYYGFSHCPIFCTPIDETTAIESSGIKEDDEHIKIYLEIPESRCVELDYYEWSDYLYYSSGEEYDDYFNFNADEALANIDKYVILGQSKTPQICIQEIYKSDIIDIKEL